ncbi:centromere protein Q isoform X2 [Dromaius novaehollandiae]|uniref:centromere protein Q isoform X2 n=1 Tax=Dromaius novaehollandiae TaxID=8790 RepID=UPI000E1E4CB2|nr:centromere protein Q isoform X2 [Dromaius novaehollandiae]
MKRHHTSSGKTGETTVGGTVKKSRKSIHQQGCSSKKKGTDGGRRKQSQKGEITQTVKWKAKEHRDNSPAAKENGSSKEIKLTSAEIASWQTLSESSKQFLETVMDSVILSVLCQQRERKEDVQKHLNLLKERMLRFFKTLKVPPGKLGNLKNFRSLQVAEKQMLETNEESLVQLQEEINEAERSAEHVDETIRQLQYKIQVLRNQLEEGEKKARKVFQKDCSGALHLPELPKHSLEAPSLQEEILKIKNKNGLLKDMNTIQQSADMKNMFTLVEKIYEKVDFI